MEQKQLSKLSNNETILVKPPYKGEDELILATDQYQRMKYRIYYMKAHIGN